VAEDKFHFRRGKLLLFIRRWLLLLGGAGREVLSVTLQRRALFLGAVDGPNPAAVQL
jgi:hypothetical protein